MRLLLASIAALALAAIPAHSLPLPGHNTFETHCNSMTDSPVDPIKSPGIRPSAHMHTHYGVTVTKDTNAKALADKAVAAALGFVQNIPGGGQWIKDPGYSPQVSTCQQYGEWNWYAIPTPNNNGMTGPTARNYKFDMNLFPRAVSLMTLTWAAPVGIPVYEPPFGMTSIVGNSHATMEEEQENEHVYWTCGDLTTKSRKPRDCTMEGGLVTGVLVFPNCFDGQAQYPNFDHQMGIDGRHFSYADADHKCPEGSVLIAQLFMSVQFGDMVNKKRMVSPLNPDGSMKLGFASGPYYTFHADFGALGSRSIAFLVAGCLNGQAYYGGFAKLNPVCSSGNKALELCPPLNPNAPDDVRPASRPCRNPAE